MDGMGPVVKRMATIRNGPINPSSPYAERLLTLSEIDSAYQNGELTRTEALHKAAEFSGGNIQILQAIFGGGK